MVLRLQGYGAWIELDGEALEEHAVEVKDNVISCYVCSEEGRQFVLHFDDDGSHSCTEAATTHGIYGRTVSVKMDGQRVAYLWGDLMGHIKSDGMPEGDFIRPYAFAPIDTTDDDDVAEREDPNNEHIGTIQVELKRATKHGNAIGSFNGTRPGTGPIHERSKKAGSHRVALGEGIYRPRKSGADVTFIDQQPWLTFRFLYRRRDMLKAQGILPQSPSPSPRSGSPGPSVKVEDRKNKGKGVKRERDDDRNDGVIEIASDDDLDCLQDELKRIQDQIARKKAKKSVKREPPSSADDVIDLT